MNHLFATVTGNMHSLDLLSLKSVKSNLVSPAPSQSYYHVLHSSFAKLLSSSKPGVSQGYVNGLLAYTSQAHLLSGNCSEEPVVGTAIANYVLCSKGMIVEVCWNVLYLLLG